MEKFASDIAYKMKKVDPSLLSHGQGNIVCSTQEWLKEVTKMSNLFDHHHPPNALVESPGCVLNFTKLLKLKFPHRNAKILYEVAKRKTKVQISGETRDYWTQKPCTFDMI